MPSIKPSITWLFALLLTPFLLLPYDVDEPSQANRMKPQDAQTPFSAEEIRLGCGQGRWIKTRISREGQPDIWQLTVFITADKEKTTLTIQNMDEEGKLVGEKMTGKASWKELQAHASFPKESCTIEKVILDGPLGTQPCWLYTVRRSENGKERLDRLWFALDMPGPPVRFTQTLAGKTGYQQEIVARGMRLEPLE